jgi:hypothetical protein
MSGLASMYGRSGLANSMPPVANVAVSNVPGAQMPLYVCGARMLSYFPVSIPTHGVALNITVQSYNGSLDYGLIACRRAVPDVADLADFVVEEHRRLFDAAMKQPSVVPVTTPAVGQTALPPQVADPTIRRPPPKPVAKKAAAKTAAGPKKAAAKKAPKKPVARKPRATTTALH